MTDPNPGTPGRLRRIWGVCWNFVAGRTRRFNWGNVVTLLFLVVVCFGAVGGAWFLSGHDSPGILKSPSKSVTPATIVQKVDLGPVTSRLDKIDSRLDVLEKNSASVPVVSAQPPAATVKAPDPVPVAKTDADIEGRVVKLEEDVEALFGNDEVNSARNAAQDQEIAKLASASKAPAPAAPVVTPPAPAAPVADNSPEASWFLKNAKFAFAASNRGAINVLDDYVQTMISSSKLDALKQRSDAEKSGLKAKVAALTSQEFGEVFLARLGL